MAEEKIDYEVGYCRPPEEHRWKPGKSGNPSGRPRRPAQPPPDDLVSALVNVLLSKQRVRINGVEQTMPIFEALAHSISTELFNATAKDKVVLLNWLSEMGVFARLRNTRVSECEHIGDLFTEEDRRLLEIINRAVDVAECGH